MTTPFSYRTPPASPRGATGVLIVIWVIWAALLMGEWSFLGVEALILSKPLAPGDPSPDPHGMHILQLICAIMFLIMVPATALIRRFIVRRARRDGLVHGAAYSFACIVSWAGCEGVVFFSLVVALIAHSFWPTILVAAAAMLVQMLSFPRRSAVLPTRESSAAM